MSWLYGLGVSIRNKLFDWKLLPVEEFSIPVISIGNLAVGGTGKTPHTEYLIRLLCQEYKVAVLSRGYKRKSKGFVLADESANSDSIGDEPFQIFNKFPQILVAVDSNRRRGIRNLLSLPSKEHPEVILLDDAYQHRYVSPSLSILLTDRNRLFTDDLLLPAGRLREPAKNKKRADMIVVTKNESDLSINESKTIENRLKIRSDQALFFSCYQYGDLIPAFSSCENFVSISDLKSEPVSVLIWAGIASPKSLVDYLKTVTNNIETIFYPDHHSYTKEDLEKLDDRFQKMQSVRKIIITTEKDVSRFIGINNFPEKLKKHVYYLPIEVDFLFSNTDLFNKKIKDHVKNFERNGILA